MINLTVGTVCYMHVRGGTNVEKVYERGVIAYFGERYVIFINENGKEYCRRKSTVEFK